LSERPVERHGTFDKQLEELFAGGATGDMYVGDPGPVPWGAVLGHYFHALVDPR